MPNAFTPINPGTPYEYSLRSINANFARLDRETVAKAFNGPNGKPVLVQGKLDKGFYGTAYYDQAGNCVKLEGTDPNGVFIELTVKDGEDAYTVLGY